MKNACIKSKQQGITLIELMIALALGAFLIGSVMQIFLNSRQTYRVQDNVSRLQENARFAMDFITRDIRMADYWGCLKGGLNNVTNNLNPAGAGYDANIHGFGQGIVGTNGAAAANAALDAPDTITLRGVNDSGISVVANFGPQANAIVNVTANTLQQGDVVLVADCSQADIFQISNANPGPANGNLVHNTGAVTDPGNLNVANPGCPGANAHCLSKIYRGDAAILRPTTITYSIQAGAGGRPALFRQIDGNAALEMVEGIENMQILYGEDTNADSTPDYFVPANAVVDMDQVVSIRVGLLATSIDDNLTSQPLAFGFNGANSPVPGDRRLRRVFSSTLAVRNRL